MLGGEIDLRYMMGIPTGPVQLLSGFYRPTTTARSGVFRDCAPPPQTRRNPGYIAPL